MHLVHHFCGIFCIGAIVVIPHFFVWSSLFLFWSLVSGTQTLSRLDPTSPSVNNCQGSSMFDLLCTLTDRRCRLNTVCHFGQWRHLTNFSCLRLGIDGRFAFIERLEYKGCWYGESDHRCLTTDLFIVLFHSESRKNGCLALLCTVHGCVFWVAIQST